MKKVASKLMGGVMGRVALLPIALLFLLISILAFPRPSLASAYQQNEKITSAAKFLPDEASTPGQKARGGNAFIFPRQAIFFNLNLGIFVFHQATTSMAITFPAYGEEGSMKQQFRLTIPLGLEINVGKYFSLNRLKLKTGLGLNALPLKAKGNFTLSMPHPYYYGHTRHHYFSEEFNNSSFLFYGFAYLVPLESWRIQLSFGPALGLATGKYPGLEDFAIEDKSPFRSSDLEVKNRVFKNSSFTALSFGGGANLAFFLVENMAFVISYKWHYLKPQIDVLEQKVNLSFSRFYFYVEYNF
jgi:hypothetical protein